VWAVTPLERAASMAFSGASAALLVLVGLLSSSFCEAAGTAFLPLPTRVGLAEGRGERLAHVSRRSKVDTEGELSGVKGAPSLHTLPTRNSDLLIPQSPPVETLTPGDSSLLWGVGKDIKTPLWEESSWQDSGLLKDAYKECERITSIYAKTFYLGTSFLDYPKRASTWAIYVWCRRTDDIVDSPRAIVEKTMNADLEEVSGHPSTGGGAVLIGPSAVALALSAVEQALG
jgi:hypothetical protein